MTLLQFSRLDDESDNLYEWIGENEWIIILLFILLIYRIVRRHRKGEHLSRWQHSFTEFNTSTDDFYERVKTLVKESNIPTGMITTVTFSSWGMGSPKRKYLRVVRGQLYFDICAAPISTSKPPRQGLKKHCCPMQTTLTTQTAKVR